MLTENFALNNGRDIGQPLSRGYKLTCLNSTTGQLLWKTEGYFAGIGTGAIGSGVFLAHNAYDNQLYCYGKGPTAVTVSAPQNVQSLGTSVLIQGSVTDQPLVRRL